MSTGGMATAANSEAYDMKVAATTKAAGTKAAAIAAEAAQAPGRPLLTPTTLLVAWDIPNDRFQQSDTATN